jgi:1,4-alpha-glucan branching enzyme
MKTIEDFITAYDIYLFKEGNHFEIHKKLGAHLIELDGVSGVIFSVWAPNATYVSVIGEFNQWDKGRTPMTNLSDSGVWACFVPELTGGALYKFYIKSRYDELERVKSDPFSFYFEVRPKTASIVYDMKSYKWDDDEWMEKRGKTEWLKEPISIYEVHPGSWMRVPEEGDRYLSYREQAEELIPYVKEMGYTHIELLPISEHPFDGSWGYQTIGYFAPTSRFGNPDDLKSFIEVAHEHNIGVILDWVPSHFPKDDHGLRYFDGTYLYEHMDERIGEHKEWGTLIFNYGRGEVRNFLISNALFWLEQFHFDGLRVDAVASMLYLDYNREEGQWLPNRYGGKENIEAIEFIKRFNEVVHEYHPGVLTIAEESTAWTGVSRPTYLGGLGFSMKWNMGWMHDMLDYFSKDPIYRKFHASSLTFSLLYAFTENFILPLSHDEVVHGKCSLLSKMPGDTWQKFANLRAFYGFMYGHPGKKLLFMGGEFGQWNEWYHDTSLDWHLCELEDHHKLQRFVSDLNELYKSEPSLYEIDFSFEGFRWIDFSDSDNSIISFVRRADKSDDLLIFVCNFTPVTRFDYRLGVPIKGRYTELLNSDSDYYGGSNVGNYGGVSSDDISFHGYDQSIKLVLPPLSTIILKPEVDN